MKTEIHIHVHVHQGSEAGAEAVKKLVVFKEEIDQSTKNISNALALAGVQKKGKTK